MGPASIPRRPLFEEIWYLFAGSLQPNSVGMSMCVKFIFSKDSRFIPYMTFLFNSLNSVRVWKHEERESTDHTHHIELLL